MNDSYWGGEIPWISAATLKRSRIDDSDQYLTEAGVRGGSKMAPAGAILILVRGMALHRETRIGMATRPVSFNQDIKALIPKSGLLPDFLLYSLQARSKRILDLVSSAGSGTGVLNTQLLQRLKIWIPDEQAQRRIVAAIDAAESYVATLERLVVKKQAIKKGMMQQLLTGKVRIQSFSGSWRSQRLSELLAYEQPGRYLVATSAYLKRGLYPVLTAGKTFILGYTDETKGVYRDSPAIIFDDFTTSSQYVDFAFKVQSSAIKILTPRSDVNLRFMYELMQVLDFQLGNHKRYWISEYGPQMVQVPERPEQDAIASVLADADAEVNLLHQRLSKAKDIKRGMMQELITGRTCLPVRAAAA